MVFRCLIRRSRIMITANKTAITIKATVFVNSRKDVDGIPLKIVSVGLFVELWIGVEVTVGDVCIGLDVGLGETELAGRVIV